MILRQQSVDPGEDLQAPSFRFVPPAQYVSWPAVADDALAASIGGLVPIRG
jgi:hypothetical protein